jgi:acetyl-CoA acetyltransferase
VPWGLAGLTLVGIDLIELNEAFAAQVLACAREWKLTLRAGDHVHRRRTGPGGRFRKALTVGEADFR